MPGVLATTKSPAASPLTPEPTASTWPTPSLPATNGNGALPRALQRRVGRREWRARAAATKPRQAGETRAQQRCQALRCIARRQARGSAQHARRRQEERSWRRADNDAPHAEAGHGRKVRRRDRRRNHAHAHGRRRQRPARREAGGGARELGVARRRRLRSRRRQAALLPPARLTGQASPCPAAARRGSTHDPIAKLARCARTACREPRQERVHTKSVAFLTSRHIETVSPLTFRHLFQSPSLGRPLTHWASLGRARISCAYSCG